MSPIRLSETEKDISFVSSNNSSQYVKNSVEVCNLFFFSLFRNSWIVATYKSDKYHMIHPLSNNLLISRVMVMAAANPNHITWEKITQTALISPLLRLKYVKPNEGTF